MADQGFFSKPSDDAQKRMLSLAGKTIKIALNALSASIGGFIGDVAELGWIYISDHYKERYKRRGEEFKARFEKAGPKVQEVIESAQMSEPLFDIFLSVYRECMNDDEDEKVRYYAALMIGFSLPGGQSVSKHQKMALLNAMKSMRVHDLYVLEALAFTRSKSHATSVTLDELKRSDSRAAITDIDWDLALASLRTLQGLGLVDDDPRQQAATVPQPNKYGQSPLGLTFWKLIGPNLEESPA
jgi:hypothetical protein